MTETGPNIPTDDDKGIGGFTLASDIDPISPDEHSGFYKTLCASTRHITETEGAEIANALIDGVRNGSTQYRGLSITGDAESHRVLIDDGELLCNAFVHNWSAGMCALLAVAAVTRCRWLELSPLGNTFSFIPIYPWK